MGDSEGSRRYTLDAQWGFKYFGLRVNGVRDDTKYFRPGLNRTAEGIHLAATVQPWKRLQIRGEFRDYSRDTVFAQAVTVRAPLTWLLPNGVRVDNQNSRYLVAFPESRQITGGAFDLNTVDSAIGPYHRDFYFNKIKSVVAEATLAEGLAIQLRYGHDARVNDAPRASSTTVFAPGAAGNNYVAPARSASSGRSTPPSSPRRSGPEPAAIAPRSRTRRTSANGSAGIRRACFARTWSLGSTR
jgi:hypothetical protein